MKEEKSYFCNCLFFSSGAFARGMNRLAEEAFAPTGLSSSYAFVMLIVNQYPEGVSPTKIAKELQLTPSTVTRLLDKLEVKQLITRTYEGKNTVVKVTEMGGAKRDELLEAWSKVNDKYTAILGKDLAKELTELIYDASVKL